MAPASLSDSTDEQPTGAGLDRNLDPSTREAANPRAHRIGCRVDPAARELTRLGIQRVKGDLISVHIEPGYDRHRASFELRFSYRAKDLAPRQGRPHFMPSLDRLRRRMICVSQGRAQDRAEFERSLQMLPEMARIDDALVAGHRL